MFLYSLKCGCTIGHQNMSTPVGAVISWLVIYILLIMNTALLNNLRKNEKESELVISFRPHKKIGLKLLNLSYQSYKVHCKKLFLQWCEL